jgi:hypothetical protein
LHARGIEHLAPDRTGRGKDQGQSDNLVEKSLREASASMGIHSTGALSGLAVLLFDNSSTGIVSIPSL